ncbi:choline transporter-like protein 2 [Trichogramma pretiosum]|uniref:choline transporter-like protein 2 n=1 Tax=Trichogramma pretiosum TaxID=7493 RepID=UPI000C718E6D|nr:choline transporter-like protein 2 [Trichogramma pretiosum]
MSNLGSLNRVPAGGGRISNLGTKITYDPTWSSPLNVKRKAENISFTVVYYLFVCLWFGVAVYALVTGDAEKYSDFYRDSEDLIFKEGWIIAIVLPLAAFLSILCLLLLRVAARPVVYTMIALFFIGLLALVITLGFFLAYDQSKLYIALFVSSVLVLIIFFWLFIVKYKFIPMICEIIREASKAMLAFPLMFFYAIAYCVVSGGFLIFTVCLFFWIESIGSDDDYPAHLVLCHLINGVALVWILCHMYGFFKVSVSGAYGTWYWTMNKKEVPKFTTLRFIYIAFRYHIGPTAFGSLIIMVCTILQILLAFASSWSGVDANAGADLYNCGLHCCDTVLYILKAVVEAVTGMAYVHIGNHGTGFIDAARISFTLFKRNYAKIAVLTQIVELLCFFMDATITALSFLLFWGLLHTQSVKLEERLGLLTCFLVCIYFTVDSIVLLLMIATDTIFMCVLEDYEMNGGSSRPYHMSNKLKDLVLENRLD